MAQLRKTLVLAILGQEVTVEVDFRLIELVERIFGQQADRLVPLFMNVENVQRRLVADVIADLLGRKLDVEWKRAEIREAVITEPAASYYVWVAQLNAALLFTLRHMEGHEYDQAMAELGKGSKKKTAATPAPPSDSPEPATT